jgi:hypothetical protein
VVSSAIVNAPPPEGVVGLLHKCSNAHMSGVDKHTKEKMVSFLDLQRLCRREDDDEIS